MTFNFHFFFLNLDPETLPLFLASFKIKYYLSLSFGARLILMWHNYLLLCCLLQSSGNIKVPVLICLSVRLSQNLSGLPFRNSGAIIIIIQTLQE